MLFKFGATFVCCLLLLADSCESKSTAGQSSAPQTASAPADNAPGAKDEAKPVSETASATGNSGASAPVLDACALIDKSEIASVQGREVQSVAPSGTTSGGLAISQCYYAVTSADGSKNLSVHLQVSEREPNNKDREAVREFWEERFHEKDREGEKEEGEESAPPLAVAGVGEEAFWMGSSKAGALYALKKDRILRISVGGPDDMKAKIEKSKTLAAKALKRLS